MPSRIDATRRRDVTPPLPRAPRRVSPRLPPCSALLRYGPTRRLAHALLAMLPLSVFLRALALVDVPTNMVSRPHLPRQPPAHSTSRRARVRPRR